MRPPSVNRRLPRDCKAVELTTTDLARLDGSLKRHWKRYRKALKRAQKDSSEEPVHDSRVEARRLLAVTDLLLPLVRGGVVEKIEKLLKRQLDLTDELRDTQVQLLAVSGLQQKIRELTDFATFLSKREQRLSKKTRRKLKNAKTGKLQKLINSCRKDLRKELKKKPAQRLCACLMKSVERVFAHTRKLFNQIEPRDSMTIHRTRVSFKKFRYIAEALTELLPGIAPDYTCKLRQYQGLMGEIQDREVLVESFRRWVLKEQPNMAWTRRAQARLKSGSRKLIRAYLDEADKLLEFWPLPASGLPAKPGEEPKRSRRANASPAREGEGSN